MRTAANRTLLSGLLCALLAATVATRAAEPPAAPAQLGELMGLLAQRHAARAHFRAIQHLAILTQPLVSEGTLIYRAPDYLEQRVSRPRPQDLILDHGQLTLQVRHRRHTVALADYPQLAPLLDSVRATLAGDQPALEQHFGIQLQGALDGWQLLLTPRNPELPVRTILLRGARDQLQDVRITQSNGDESDLHIEPLPPGPSGEPSG